MENQNCLIYLHGIFNSVKNCLQVANICTKLGICYFECQSLDALIFMAKSVMPRYIVVEIQQSVDQKIIDGVCSFFSNCFVFFSNVESQNGDNFLDKANICVENMQTLQTKLDNYNKFLSNHMFNYATDKNFYEKVAWQFNKLCFNHKNIGEKYLFELIFEIYQHNKSFGTNFCEFYKILAKRYGVSPSSVVRDIKFCIKKAYSQNGNMQVFENISKSHKIPSIKQFVSFIINNLTCQVVEKQILCA